MLKSAKNEKNVAFYDIFAKNQYFAAIISAKWIHFAHQYKCWDPKTDIRMLPLLMATNPRKNEVRRANIERYRPHLFQGLKNPKTTKFAKFTVKTSPPELKAKKKTQNKKPKIKTPFKKLV